MLEWIKRHKVFVIICFVIIVIGVPFAIHCLFKIHPTEDYDFFVSEWSAGELLQYYGGVWYGDFGSIVIASKRNY